jgi:hypothetical protein
MHEAIKQWASQRLTACFLEDYEGTVNEEGNWQLANGKMVKWEIKETKLPDTETLARALAFSMIGTFALASALKRDPHLLAEELSQKLTETAPHAWSFFALKGYINAYFQPSCLSDYGFVGIKDVQNTLGDLVSGEYALYRLKVLQKSLMAKKVVPLSLEEPLSNASIQRFGHLFLMPTTPLEWQRWVSQVEKMTVDGTLIGLDDQMSSALLAFLIEI